MTSSAPARTAAFTAAFAAVVISSLPVSTGGSSATAAAPPEPPAEELPAESSTVHGGWVGTVVVETGGRGALGGPHAATTSSAPAPMAASVIRRLFSLLRAVARTRPW